VCACDLLFCTAKVRLIFGNARKNFFFKSIRFFSVLLLSFCSTIKFSYFNTRTPILLMPVKLLSSLLILWCTVLAPLVVIFALYEPSRGRVYDAWMFLSRCANLFEFKKVMGQPSIWGSPARESQLQGGGSAELQGLLKTLLQKSSVNSHPQSNKSAAIPVSLPDSLHCTLASYGTVYCNRSCLWVCVFVCGSVITITQNCVHWSSSNGVCRWR